MNQMVATLYTATNAGSSTPQGNAAAQPKADSHPEEESQPKRKQSSEKFVKQVKRKKPSESVVANDIDGRLDLLSLRAHHDQLSLGPDVEFSTTTFADFAAAESFKEVNHHGWRNWLKQIDEYLELDSSNLFHSQTGRIHSKWKDTTAWFPPAWATRRGKVSASPSIIRGTMPASSSEKNRLLHLFVDW